MGSPRARETLASSSSSRLGPAAGPMVQGEPSDPGRGRRSEGGGPKAALIWSPKLYSPPPAPLLPVGVAPDFSIRFPKFSSPAANNLWGEEAEGLTSARASQGQGWLVTGLFLSVPSLSWRNPGVQRAFFARDLGASSSPCI